MNKQITIVASSFVLKDRKFLVAKRADDDDFMAGYWEIPGGKVDDDEDLKLATIREMQEECGIDIIAEYVLVLKHYFHETNPNREYIEIFYLGKQIDNNQEVTLSHEHSEYRWVTFQELKALQPISRYTFGVLDELASHPLVTNQLGVM